MSTIKDAAAHIGRSKTLALACHVGPDGDALGSMMGLAVAASNAGRAAVASFGEPHVMPPSLRFLPIEHLVDPAEFPSEPDTMIVLDAGSPDRLGSLASNAGKADTVVVLDHHVTNQGFGDIAVVDPDAAATGELVFDLLNELGWEITPEVAQCLLTALVTDTGRFQYSNTTPRTLEIAARLVEAGGRPDVIGRHVYEEAPFGYLKAAAIALDRAQLDEGKSVVSTVLTEEDLHAQEIDWTDTENLIDLVRLAEEADVAVLLKVHADGRTKGSLRSRGDTDVGAIAKTFGGGGHRLAAGFTTDQTPEEVLASIFDMVEDHR